ncbi:MAG: pyridoxamine 5'-phosphate oxidase family protein [Candidatus Omnitrophica bacterium]|nr:pyridoxamine 5'-phosphate oxidase family protein [Candidatus Omnitrophota bacterium]
MVKLTENIVQFFENQGFVIVSTIDKRGSINNACKGIVKIERKGKIYLLDLYKGRTFNNLKANPHLSITAVDEHKFIGYCLKGKARIVERQRLIPEISEAWEKRLTRRITQRILKNITGEKGHTAHPESLLPKPAYTIVMGVEEIIDLTPRHLK